jgi:hypothetical protein
VEEREPRRLEAVFWPFVVPFALLCLGTNARIGVATAAKNPPFGDTTDAIKGKSSKKPARHGSTESKKHNQVPSVESASGFT